MNIPIEQKLQEEPRLQSNIMVRLDNDTKTLIRKVAKERKLAISTVARVFMHAGAAQYKKEKGPQ